MGPFLRAKETQISPRGFCREPRTSTRGHGAKAQPLTLDLCNERQLEDWNRIIATTLRGPCLLSLAPLLISNNTGPVHMAAALDTPVVDLYALTNPQHAPWNVPHRMLYHDVPCKFCYKSICPMGHHNCLRLVSPQAVLELLEEVKASHETDAVKD